MKNKILINSKLNDYSLANQGSRAKRGVLISLTIILASLIGLSGFSEIQAENQSEIDKAIDYLKLQPSDPWITMALIAAGKTDSDLNYLKTVNCVSATDYEKTILAITAAGENPRTFGNIDFVSQLESFYQNNQIGSSDYLNDDFWGILALVSAGEDPSSQIIQDSKNFILTNQNSDGGFPFSGGWGSDIDDTAAAIMALLESGISSDDPVIAKAVDYLKTNQNNDGGFPYDPVSPWGTGSDASSDAWVISAVNKLGEDPDGSSWSKNGVSPVDHLLSLQAGGGYFEYQESTGEDSFSPVTTSYAVIALSQKFYPIDRWSASTDSNGGGGVITYTINASAGEHGLIFFSGVVRVGADSDEAFTITPDAGYHVSDVLVDGVSVGAVTSYTFTGVTTDHTIAVSFAVDPPQPTKKSGDITGDNVINEYDFAVLIEDWGQAGLGTADLNHDGAVNEYDLALLMLNWGGIFGLNHMVYADSSILSISPASLNSTVNRVFNISIQIDPASNNVCVVKGFLSFDNLSCQAITVASGIMAQTVPTCADPSFILGIPHCTTTAQSILSVSTKGVQAGQGNLSLTEVNVIGAGIDVPFSAIDVSFSAEGGVYNITAVSITAPEIIQQDAGQQKQATTPQQEESLVAPAAPIIPEAVTPASLLIVMVKILSFGTGKDWLAVIVTILIILVLATFYFVIMKKNIYIIIGVGVIVVGGWLLFSNGFWQDRVKETDIVQEIIEKEVVLVIDDGGGNPNTFVAEFKEGMTAFDLLEEEAEILALALKTKNYGIGIFIEAIGDKENGQDGKYWLYYVNGQPPMVAADKKEIKAGDKVEFKFEKSTF